MIKPKKSLGQNFLIDDKILCKIVELVDLKNKIVLEIGPGTGNLTSYILQKKPKKIIGIEKDNYLALKLKEKFKSELTIINDDVLNINENLLSSDELTVFGNLPYNISTEILSKWILNIDDRFWFNNLILMFQKEVADRIIAKFNTSAYGRLSILTNWKLNVEKIIDIQPDSFSPKPKVQSSLLLFTPKKNFYKMKNPANLEKVTRIFFNNRRKMLKKPFNQLFNGNQTILDKLKIDLNLRPQNLKPLTYFQITNEYEKLLS